MNARIQPFVNPEQHLQDEIAILLVRAEKGVRRTRLADAFDSPVDDPVFGRTGDRLPAVQVFAVEKCLPLSLCSDNGTGPQE